MGFLSDIKTHGITADEIQKAIDATDSGGNLDTDEGAQVFSVGGRSALIHNKVNRRRDLVELYNSTDTPIKEFQVVGVDSTPILRPRSSDDADGYSPAYVLKAVTPNPNDHATRFAVSSGPVEPGATGAFFVSGVCPVRLSVTSTSDKFASLADNSGKLKTGASGVPLLMNGAATGDGVGVVNLAPAPSPQLFRITDAVRDGSNWRWTYTMKAAKPSDPEDPWAFADADGARDVTGINLAEVLNDDTTAAGQIIDDLPGTWLPNPVPNDQPVVPLSTAVDSDGATIYYFYFATTFDGACDTGSGSGA